MKCINKQYIKLCGIIFILFLFTGCAPEEDIITPYETEKYNVNLYTGELYSEELCVSSENVSIEGFTGDASLTASALFDLSESKVSFAEKIHEKIYPASTTKIVTALIALERCSMDEIVTISAQSAASSFALDEQVCGLKEGDQITVEALLYGLLVYSGNDTAVALAEHIGGSVEAFVGIMNQKARDVFATNTNFVTPNGLHNENHYTTAYDLYLIFNECIKYEKFIEIISAESYTADVTGMDGVVRQLKWQPTSFYARNLVMNPTGADVIGGKTGYTGEAGNCLILLNTDETGNQYISIVMGAKDKPLLYEDMNALINQIPNT